MLGAKAAGNGKVSSLEWAGQDAVFQPGEGWFMGVRLRGRQQAGQQHAGCRRTDGAELRRW